MHFLQYIVVTQSIYTVDHFIQRICLRWSTDDEIDHGPGKMAGTSD